MISDYFDEVYEIILQNPNFIRNIKNFKINLSTTISNNITRFLIFFGSNCNSISSFYIKFPLYQQINEENLSQFIDSQKNLEKILFRSNIYFPLYYTFLSLKNSNCSNTLNTIIFYYIDFKNTLVLSEVINQLNVLESIHIVCCSSLNSNFSQQINNIHKPFKLKTLILKTILHIESLKLLIRKSGDHLECFGNVDCRLHKSDKSSQLLESTLKYCNNIKFLYLQFASSYKKIDLLFSLIKNIKQNLNYLHIDVLSNISNISISSIILKNLGQILPRKLEYLSFCLDINDTNDLRMFYKNSQNTYIKKLSIHHSEINYNYDNVFSCTKQCIMKQERVKYLAVTETTNRGNQNKSLSFIKDEVKQYNSYGIQVLKHRDLIIDIRNFIEQHYY
ncbi:hypothetical protein GLOIN_2v1869164 [Rhizophagus clarus]|nr:hypothetical protein GLOIN_2v1869164 [Rhizophagus clarus]